jgi:hypothetical protein
MKIEETYYSLLSHILAAMNEPTNCNYFRDEPFINFFNLILVIILIIFSALLLIFEITNEHSIHISTKKGSSIISENHSIRVYHRYYFKDEFLAE